MAYSLMVLGTASSVGKSIITAGFCRVFRNDGYKVAPFKSQNMALNSFITKDGHEMGRAQVVQAEASKIEPSVMMNPILLKPTSDKKSQVIINGKVYKNMDAMEYHLFKPKLKEIIQDSYAKLSAENDIIVLEGAGSPAEINLRENDIVNMGMAKISDSMCILVADIDRGGVFASVVGTVMLLLPDERKRIKGIVINKFRGDIQILQPGLRQLEEITGIPVIGVMPYFDVKIEDEDSLAQKFEENTLQQEYKIDILVIKLPYISNFTDFNSLENIKGVRLRYCNDVSEFGKPDMIIIPGSKSTINDMRYLINSGIGDLVLQNYKNETPIFGVCAGMQILGKSIKDPHGFESEIKEIAGLGLLDIETVFEKEKTTLQVKASVNCDNIFVDSDLDNIIVEGYEIHMGSTEYGSEVIPFVIREDGEIIGVCDKKCNVYGTYLHGIFDNKLFCRYILNKIGFKNDFEDNDFKDFKEKQFQKLESFMRQNINIQKVYEIMGIEK
jgi:adenosylcobyric acid synthase